MIKRKGKVLNIRPYAMQHWNHSPLVAVDLFTTGSDPNVHDAYEIAFIPLDSNICIRKDIIPLHSGLHVEYPELIDEKIKTKALRMISRGLPKYKFLEVFQAWVDKMQLPANRYGYERVKIMLLGHDMPLKQIYLRKLFEGIYDEYFHLDCRDVAVIANFINDRCGYRGNRVAYSKRNLRWLAARAEGLPETLEKSALEFANFAAQTYRHMVKYDYPLILDDHCFQGREIEAEASELEPLPESVFDVSKI
jgi:hypothetical protein